MSSSPADFDPPCDLCLPLDDSSGPVKPVVLRAFALGYRTVAVERRVDQEELTTKTSAKKAKRARTEESAKKTDFPAPPEVNLSKAEMKEFTSGSGRQPRVLTRLTVKFRDNNFLPIFNRSSTAARYDLLALCPTSAQGLQALLKTGFRADILTFEPENSRDVRWTRKLYQECAGAKGGAGGGMVFEIPYAPAIRDSTDRRRIIAQAHNYHSVGKSRRIVLSSGARAPIELRGPHDVANLAFLLGMSEEQGHLAVGKMPLEAIRNSLGRKLGPFRAKIEKISEMQPHDKWKVPGVNEAASPKKSDSKESAEDDSAEGEEQS